MDIVKLIKKLHFDYENYKGKNLTFDHDATFLGKFLDKIGKSKF